jgi:hypothetical protein
MPPVGPLLALALIAGQPPLGPDGEDAAAGAVGHEAVRLVRDQSWHQQQYAHLSRRRSAPSMPAAGMSSQDRATTRDWQARNPGWTPPPASANAAAQMQPGHPLPRGARGSPAPMTLASRLPSYPNHSYVVVGSSLVLVDTTTNTVVDILWDVFKT